MFFFCMFRPLLVIIRRNNRYYKELFYIFGLNIGVYYIIMKEFRLFVDY
jgi:hypothetical protein